MKITQISIFLENAAGRLAQVMQVLKDGGVSCRAIMVADTADFGILRIIADNPEKAIATLHGANFTTKTTPVLEVSADSPNESLAPIIDAFAKSKVNIDYLYATLATEKAPSIIFKVSDIAKGIKALKENGY